MKKIKENWKNKCVCESFQNSLVTQNSTGVRPKGVEEQ